jgi:hypothetical protein
MTVQETTRYTLAIGGKSVPTQDHFEVRSPSTGELVGIAYKATIADLDAAAESAQTACASWSKTSQNEHRKLCHAAVQKLVVNAEEIARLITLEQCKPLNGRSSRFEMGAPALGRIIPQISVPGEGLPRTTTSAALSCIALQSEPSARSRPGIDPC